MADAGNGMRTSVRAYGGLITPKCLLLLLLVFAMVTPSVSAAINLGWSPYFNFGTAGDPGGIDYSHYNTSTQLADTVAPNTTPWEVWLISGIVGILLFLYSIRPVRSMDELESSIIVAVMSCVSIGFCAYASLSIDRIVGFGVSSQVVNTTAVPPSGSIYNHEYVYMENHLIYTEPAIAILMTIFFFVIIGYTLYRVSKHRAMLGVSGEDEE